VNAYWSRRLIAVALVVIMGGLKPAPTVVPPKPSLRSAEDPRPPGVLVDIGGQKLHINCTGHGSPTVLLESGAADFSVV